MKIRISLGLPRYFWLKTMSAVVIKHREHTVWSTILLTIQWYYTKKGKMLSLQLFFKSFILRGMEDVLAWDNLVTRKPHSNPCQINAKVTMPEDPWRNNFSVFYGKSLKWTIKHTFHISEKNTSCGYLDGFTVWIKSLKAEISGWCYEKIRVHGNESRMKCLILPVNSLFEVVTYSLKGLHVPSCEYITIRVESYQPEPWYLCNSPPDCSIRTEQITQVYQ